MGSKGGRASAHGHLEVWVRRMGEYGGRQCIGVNTRIHADCIRTTLSSWLTRSSSTIRRLPKLIPRHQSWSLGQYTLFAAATIFVGFTLP